MGRGPDSGDELLKELEEAVLRVRQLEEALLESTKKRTIPEDGEVFQELAYEKSPEVNSFESTQTLDLTNLFSSDVTSSGSYYTKGIRKTLFGRLMEALPVPALLVSGSKHVVFANRAWGRIAPTYDKAVGKGFCDLFSGAPTAKDLDAAVNKVFASRQVLSKKAALQIGGHEIWGRTTLRSVRLGPDRYLLALVEDLTEEKKQLLLKQEHQEALKREIRRREGIEQALWQSRQRLEMAFSGADLFPWDWDFRNRCQIWDSRFLEFLGYGGGETEPSKKWWEELVHPEDRAGLAEAIKRYFQGSSSMLEHEHRVRARSGQWKWIVTRGKIVEKDQQGRPLRLLGISLDITERKESEQRVRHLTHVMIQAVERDREQTSLDLHDQVAQDLAALRLMLESTLPALPDARPGLSATIEQASGKVREVIKAVRGISYRLRPVGLDRLGLVSTVRQFCEEFSAKHSIRADFLTSGMEELPLDFDTEINLFRVIQESLNNVAKHSEATRVTVELVGKVGRIALSIEDNGRGFRGEEASDKGLTGEKMGLWCMEQRVGLLKGKLTMRSGPQQGTKILVEVPYRRE